MNKFVKFTDAATSHEIFVNVTHIIAVTPDFSRPNANVDSHGKSSKSDVHDRRERRRSDAEARRLAFPSAPCNLMATLSIFRKAATRVG